MVRLKRNYIDTSQFDNGILPFGKAFATSLQWLYDDDEFNDETISEDEYDRNCQYYMDGVLPICDFMSVVTDVIYLAIKDFGEPNIKNYINLIEKDHVIIGYSEPILQYEGDHMILGRVKPQTTEVILWAAYLYCHLRRDLEPENERLVRADKLLYKLFSKKTFIKPEFVKDTFLMKHFRQTMLIFLNNIPTHKSEHEEENTQDIQQAANMEESVLDKISANNIRFYYEGWRNGKHGSICQRNCIYRFIEQAHGKSGMLDDVKRNEDDNPIVAIGIVAYWLQFNSRMDTVIKSMTKYKGEIPKDIREQFDNYTQIRFEEFRNEHRDDPNTWDWDWKYEFYAKYIIPHEIEWNKMSEALFDYISDSDIALVRAVMKCYIKYLKKCRAEKGYRVSPELLVLRAVDSQDDTKYEDLEDYEVNTILDNLEGEGYIKVAWISGHRPEATRMLDKGHAYLKQLEEREDVIDVAPVKTPQPFFEEYSTGFQTQTTQLDDDSEYVEDEEWDEDEDEDDGEYGDEDEVWDNQYDTIFDKKIDYHKVKLQIEILISDKVKGKRRWYVLYRVFKYLEWTKVTQKKFIDWITHHYDWEGVNEFRGVQTEFINSNPPNWKDLIIKGKDGFPDNEDLGPDYYDFAEQIRDTFVNVDNNGEMHDKNEFLINSKQGGVAHHNLWK